MQRPETTYSTFEYKWIIRHRTIFIKIFTTIHTYVYLNQVFGRPNLIFLSHTAILNLNIFNSSNFTAKVFYNVKIKTLKVENFNNFFKKTQ